MSKKDLHKELRDSLEFDEGFREFPYRCTQNKLTIGFGRNIEDKGITEQEARFLLVNDMMECLVDLNTILPDYERLPFNIKLVLGNMRFQLGGRGLRKFKKMLKAVKLEDWEEMRYQMKASRWYKQTVRRAERLRNLVKEVADKNPTQESIKKQRVR